MAIKRSGIEFLKIIVFILHLKTKSNEREQYGDQLQLQGSGLILKRFRPPQPSQVVAEMVLYTNTLFLTQL